MEPFPLLELRQYTVRRGAREEFIELFESELVDPQQALGIQVLGQFRDLNDPDRFVWLRAFPGLTERARALGAFYVDSAAWKTHGGAATSLLADFTDVRLLRVATPGLAPSGRPGARLRARIRDADAPDHETAMAMATYETETGPNDFPMPVRSTPVTVDFAWTDDADEDPGRLAPTERSWLR
ncbi:NIPSNAP family protein [Mycolicibacterium brumae]|uniref:NIPSNAP family protein n=1 Tax=Mycolicibacterium brumae TaxID=85968 RepID=A0A2G5PHD4_9MYCO|nr:NIPSNAP family protein [Mycolicibacterium brumae]MCV7194465.1 NIPSNAP family protein [Mycolicibacterium brumae]PIB77718.1 NIPSNAP family protein [Mycolicibacterium brumae]RWA20074.1 hypothetical protein MBRU_15690 [Mycolicibacterium brumae DSM 44177]UWW10000.1 NIPSNAP family protein [Mycolicibacterium brumae]